MSNVDDLVAKLQSDIDTLKANMPTWDSNKSNIDNLKAGAETVYKVIKLVEASNAELALYTSAEKEEAGAEIIAKLFPFGFNWIEVLVIKHLLSIGVDSLNKKYGQDWYSHVDEEITKISAIADGIEEATKNI